MLAKVCSAAVNGIEAYLSEKNYFFFTVAHRHDPRLLQTYSEMLLARGIEGLITIDTSIEESPSTYVKAKIEGLKDVMTVRKSMKMILQEAKYLSHTARTPVIAEAPTTTTTTTTTTTSTTSTTTSTPSTTTSTTLKDKGPEANPAPSPDLSPKN